MNDWRNLPRDETSEWMQALKWFGIALAIGLTETPALERTYQKYRPQGLVILGVNSAEQDMLKEAEAFANEFKVTYPLLWDETDEVLKTYAVLGLPTSAFVNSEGLIQRIYIGVMSDEQIEDFIGEIIK